MSLNGSLVNKPDKPLPWPDFVRLAGQVGYGGVDVNLTAAFKEGVETTRARLAEARVRPAIANLPMQFLTADEAAFQESLKGLDAYAKFAAAIGVHRMMAVLSPGSPVPKDERHRFVKARLAPIAEILAASKIRLGLEFLGVLAFRTGPRAPHQYIWTLNDTVALASDVAPNIGVVLDVWHWHHSGGTVADILATPNSRIVHIHASDARAQPPEEVRDNGRLMPGEGIIDSTGFFRALDKIGYEDAVSPEPLGRIPVEMTPEAAARLALETTVAVLRKAGVEVRQG
ncbi:MAG TPA: sugar phosphate isomerase/epimerase family protein [Vicinamibacterales bacterium]|nr:sugar phosphate isomerase/epimerase family protein [Vicinamibacterales bacterium]